MSDSKQRYDAMLVTEYQSNGETKTFWQKIGAAFTNRDGSIGVQLDAFPVSGKIVLQVPLSKEEREAMKNNKQQGGGQQRGQQRGGGGRQQRNVGQGVGHGGGRRQQAPAPAPEFPDDNDGGYAGGPDDEIPF